MKLFRIKNELTCFFSDWNRRHALMHWSASSSLVQVAGHGTGTLIWRSTKWSGGRQKLRTLQKVWEVVWKDKLESHAKGDDILDIEPGQVATYLEDPPGPLSVLILVIMVLWNNYKFIFVSLYLICSNLCISDMSLPLFWC